jgi:hypothetical protein
MQWRHPGIFALATLVFIFCMLTSAILTVAARIGLINRNNKLLQWFLTVFVFTSILCFMVGFATGFLNL